MVLLGKSFKRDTVNFVEYWNTVGNDFYRGILFVLSKKKENKYYKKLHG